jgi:hypothetical protein
MSVTHGGTSNQERKETVDPVQIHIRIAAVSGGFLLEETDEITGSSLRLIGVAGTPLKAGLVIKDYVIEQLKQRAVK